MLGCTAIATVLPFEQVTYCNTVVGGYFSFAVTEVAVLSITFQLANQVVIHPIAWNIQYANIVHVIIHVHTHTPVHTHRARVDSVRLETFQVSTENVIHQSSFLHRSLLVCVCLPLTVILGLLFKSHRRDTFRRRRVVGRERASGYRLGQTRIARVALTSRGVVAASRSGHCFGTSRVFKSCRRLQACFPSG